MKTNPWPTLEDWVQSDEVLFNKLEELEQSDLTIMEQAKNVLDFLTEIYQLPTYPEDVEDRDWQNVGDSFYLPISIFEQIAQLCFVEPENSDPRYLVINAVYLMNHKLHIDMSEVLEEYLGNEELQGFGYRGEDLFDAELVPVKKGESWFDLNCRIFIKEIV